MNRKLRNNVLKRYMYTNVATEINKSHFMWLSTLFARNVFMILLYVHCKTSTDFDFSSGLLKLLLVSLEKVIIKIF